jgi:phosphoserine phosphatase
MKYLKIFETFDRNDTLYVFDFDDTLVNTPEFEGFVIEYLTEDVSIK